MTADTQSGNLEAIAIPTPRPPQRRPISLAHRAAGCFGRLAGIGAAIVAVGLTNPPAVRCDVERAGTSTEPRDSTIRILFIGNSFTYVNNLPDLVHGLAAGMARPIEVETQQVTVGGATLKQLWSAGPALQAIRGSRWDYVVLQEQSTLGATLVNGQAVISDPNRLFWPAARLFDAEIRKTGAKTMLLQTWGQKGRPENFDALAHAYFTIGRELGAIVVPAGLAWQRALAERADLPLYLQDGSHPAAAGSYLAAMMTIATLVGTPPNALPLTVSGHPTGLDGQPAEMVGTLATIDPATFQLFHRVVTAVRREIKQAGGYLQVRRPPMPTVPPIPAGRPIPPGALAGSWTGTILLFLGAERRPLILDLAASNGSYHAAVSVELDQVHKADALDLEVDQRELRFSIASPIDDGIQIRFRGVLTADNRLDGTAAMISEERGWDFTGTWSATRQPSSQ